MNIGVIIFVIFIVVQVIRAISGGGNSRAHNLLQQKVDSGLKVHCIEDVWESDDGESLPIIRVEIAGTFVVPRANFPGMIRVRITDVTEDVDDPYAIFCSIPDMADEDGIFTVDHELTVPYEVSEVDGMEITNLPLFALVAPKRGRRRFRVIVAVTAAHNLEDIYGFGERTISYEFDRVGYMEMKEHSEQQERKVAVLAVAVCAADGHMDKRETAVIRRFFGEHLQGRDDEAERKEKITNILKQTMSSIRNKEVKVADLIKNTCREIREDDDPALSQTSFELCVQIVAADDVVEDSEEKALAYIAKHLELPHDCVREIRDRNFRLSMFDEADDEKMLGMPAGLSDDEKREFLNSEYRKWRSRVTHADPSVAAEASLRLERVTKLRRELVQ